jgi:hypothetical protein
MTAERDDSAKRDQRLEAVLHSYLQAVDAGCRDENDGVNLWRAATVLDGLVGPPSVP